MSTSNRSIQHSDLMKFYRLALSAIISQALGVIAKLEIADLLKEGEKSTEQLAKLTSTYEPFLYRVMRTLAAEGIFEETTPRIFKLTPMGTLLCSGDPGSLKYVPLTNVDTWRWHAVEHLLDSVKNGKPCVHYSHGVDDYYDLLDDNREAYSNYIKGLSGTTHNFHSPFLDQYDFSGVNRIVDIGGGEGRLLSSILTRNPHLTGVLLDTAPTLKTAKTLLETDGLLERCELVEGDFFTEVPADGDLYLMSYIAADWSDEALIKLLKNIHKATCLTDTKLLVLDSVIPDDNEFHLSKWIDLVLISFGYGRLRTKLEFAQVYEQAGFDWVNTFELGTPISVMELEAL